LLHDPPFEQGPDEHGSGGAKENYEEKNEAMPCHIIDK
jgi:hypothetical protein